jgi:hypothetical protein
MTAKHSESAGDLPEEAAARLAMIRRQLPDGWRVARTYQDAGGSWVAELVDESGQVMAQVALHEAER